MNAIAIKTKTIELVPARTADISSLTWRTSDDAFQRKLAVTEHEETRAKTELGAAQKDTARELSAKLASLKGIVWVGVAVFRGQSSRPKMSPEAFGDED